jgi:hypothetical protein
MEVYELSMPIIVGELDAFGSRIRNENLFCTIDITTNILKDLIGRKLYTYHQYLVDEIVAITP